MLGVLRGGEVQDFKPLLYFPSENCWFIYCDEVLVHAEIAYVCGQCVLWLLPYTEDNNT